MKVNKEPSFLEKFKGKIENVGKDGFPGLFSTNSTNTHKKPQLSKKSKQSDNYNTNPKEKNNENEEFYTNITDQNLDLDSENTNFPVNYKPIIMDSSNINNLNNINNSKPQAILKNNIKYNNSNVKVLNSKSTNKNIDDNKQIKGLPVINQMRNRSLNKPLLKPIKQNIFMNMNNNGNQKAMIDSQLNPFNVNQQSILAELNKQQQLRLHSSPLASMLTNNNINNMRNNIIPYMNDYNFAFTNYNEMNNLNNGYNGYNGVNMNQFPNIPPYFINMYDNQQQQQAYYMNQMPNQLISNPMNMYNNQMMTNNQYYNNPINQYNLALQNTNINSNMMNNKNTFNSNIETNNKRNLMRKKINSTNNGSNANNANNSNIIRQVKSVNSISSNSNADDIRNIAKKNLINFKNNKPVVPKTLSNIENYIEADSRNMVNQMENAISNDNSRQINQKNSQILSQDLDMNNIDIGNYNTADPYYYNHQNQQQRPVSNTQLNQTNDDQKIYKPYTLHEYKEISDNFVKINSGGLGANIGTKEWNEKFEKVQKQKQYAEEIKKMNNHIKHNYKDPALENKEKIKKQIETSNRQKALMYCKNKLPSLHIKKRTDTSEFGEESKNNYSNNISLINKNSNNNNTYYTNNTNMNINNTQNNYNYKIKNRNTANINSIYDTNNTFNNKTLNTNNEAKNNKNDYMTCDAQSQKEGVYDYLLKTNNKTANNLNLEEQKENGSNNNLIENLKKNEYYMREINKIKESLLETSPKDKKTYDKTNKELNRNPSKISSNTNKIKDIKIDSEQHIELLEKYKFPLDDSLLNKNTTLDTNTIDKIDQVALPKELESKINKGKEDKIPNKPYNYSKHIEQKEYNKISNKFNDYYTNNSNYNDDNSNSNSNNNNEDMYDRPAKEDSNIALNINENISDNNIDQVNYELSNTGIIEKSFTNNLANDKNNGVKIKQDNPDNKDGSDLEELMKKRVNYNDEVNKIKESILNNI